ncbi:MAG: AI-2E family transporter [Deltaproteobacteria bacterium]|nr:AI-2E family transporter [Deltaproteobacteria bacterium]
MDTEVTSDRGNAPPSREVRYVVHVMLLISLYLAYLVLRPFLHSIVFAAVLASLCVPLQKFFERPLHGRRGLAAFCVVVMAAVVIAVPLLLFIAALAAEGVDSVNRVQGWLQAGGVETLLHHPRLAQITAWARERLPFAAHLDLGQQLLAYSKRAGEALLGQGAGLAANVVALAVHSFVMLFVLFYLVRDGHQMMAALKALTPLQEHQDERIAARIREMARSVFVGSFLTAACQGLAGGIGLALVGIPGLFWGAVMGVVSLIPIVGTALVWVPAAGYLFLVGRWRSALFLLGWCTVVVGLTDNVLRPFLMRGRSGLSPMFVFLAVMGGLEYFGLPGLLYGPLILTFAAAILYLYKEEFPTVRRGAL